MELPTTLPDWSDLLWHNTPVWQAVRGYKDKVSDTMRGMVVLPTTRKADGLFEYLCATVAREAIPFQYHEGEHSFQVPTAGAEYIQRFVNLEAIRWAESKNLEVFLYNSKTDKNHKYTGQLPA